MKTLAFLIFVICISATCSLSILSLRPETRSKRSMPSAAAILRRFAKREVPINLPNGDGENDFEVDDEELTLPGGRKARCFWPFISYDYPLLPPPPPPGIYGPGFGNGQAPFGFNPPPPGPGYGQGPGFGPNYPYKRENQPQPGFPYQGEKPEPAS